MAEVDPELVKRLAELIDAPPWEMADLLVERFPDEDYSTSGNAGARTGLYQELEQYEDALRQERGVILKASTMRNYRATALAWPGAVRTAPAAFDAYSRLRGKDGHERMQRYLKRNKGRPLSKKDVQRYRADDKGAMPVETPEERFEKRVRSTVRSVLMGGIKPTGDWWKSSSISLEVREMAAVVLHQLANDLIEGAEG